MKKYKRICTICQKEFSSSHPGKFICSKKCRAECKVLTGYRRSGLFCCICGFGETVDIHHEQGGEFVLCPNHHALITRGIKTLKQILNRNWYNTIYGCKKSVSIRKTKENKKRHKKRNNA